MLLSVRAFTRTEVSLLDQNVANMSCELVVSLTVRCTNNDEIPLFLGPADIRSAAKAGLHGREFGSEPFGPTDDDPSVQRCFRYNHPYRSGDSDPLERSKCSVISPGSMFGFASI